MKNFEQWWEENYLGNFNSDTLESQIKDIAFKSWLASEMNQKAELIRNISPLEKCHDS